MELGLKKYIGYMSLTNINRLIVTALCCLMSALALQAQDGLNIAGAFAPKYRDMPDATETVLTRKNLRDVSLSLYHGITVKNHPELAGELEAMEAYCTGYKQFLDAGKTERECVDRTVALAEQAGFKPYVRGGELKPGDKVYRVNRGKAITLAIIGKRPLSEGANIGAAHIDSPRLDLKQNPLYEAEELAYLKTHYYGGIRKYQWVTIPLELHGVVALKGGQTVRVSIGGGEDDPLFTIDDLLPHLGVEQSKKPLGEAIPGESLNIQIPLQRGNDFDLLVLLKKAHSESPLKYRKFGYCLP